MYNECRHIFTSGKKCQSPALSDQNFCYFHSNTRKRPAPANQPYQPYVEPKERALALPPLEDADAIQLALSDVILALAANRIDPRRARILIYGLQVASQNHRHGHAIEAAEEAREAACTERSRRVRETHQHEDGTLIGPPKQSPEPEEVAAKKRPPRLGEILLREAEALHARRLAEKEAEERRQRELEAAKSAQLSVSFPDDAREIHAVADTSSACCQRSSRNRGPRNARSSPCGVEEMWGFPPRSSSALS
jgi:hypothetical protein